MEYMMKIFVISITLILFLSIFGFTQDNHQLSIHDIIGTYQLSRIEKSWFLDNQREEVINWLSNFKYLEINENYYIIGPYEKIETTYIITEKGDEASVLLFDGYIYTCSEFRHLFPEYPRPFNSVLTCSGVIWVIEVIDFETIIINLRNSYLLYKKI